MDDWRLKPAGDLGLPLGDRLRSVRRERGSAPWAFHLLSWSIVGLLLRVYHRLKIEGRENLPRNWSFILVANHSSHLDTLALGCCIPRRLRPDSFPIAAGDMFLKSPAIALISALFINALPLGRKSTVTYTLSDLRDRLAASPCIFVVFPEGTRTRDGHMTKFKSGLGMIVAGTTTPVIPRAIWGTFAALPAGKRFPKPFPLRVKIGEPLNFQFIANDRRGWDEIAHRTEAAVRRLAIKSSA